MWFIDIHRSTDGLYHWRLWAADGRAACASAQGYQAWFNAERQARRFSDEARDLQYEVTPDGEGSRWRAVDGDGRAVARSLPVFPSDVAAGTAVDQVRKYAGIARGL